MSLSSVVAILNHLWIYYGSKGKLILYDSIMVLKLVIFLYNLFSRLTSLGSVLQV